MVGVGIGILSWLSFLINKKALGCSTSFAKTSGMREKLLRGPSVALKPYYQRIKLNIDWQWMLVLGIVFGALSSSLLSGDFSIQWVPNLWTSAFGNTPVIRLVIVFVGGIFLGFSSRWADGCTSWHRISGDLQLAVLSWISAIAFFVSGILMAHIMFNSIAL